MARTESIKLQTHIIKINAKRVEFIQSKCLPDYQLPQIYWNNNDPWDEVNLYAYDLLLNENLNIKTVKSNIFHLNAYATWLEENNIDWTYFPETRSERCLVVFRGDLIRKRDSLDLSPSTTTQRMRAVIKFYKWLKEKNLIDTNVLMWKDKVYKKKII